jgi:hypothetical protein
MAFASHARLIPAADLAALDKDLRKAFIAGDEPAATTAIELAPTPVETKVIPMKLANDTDDHLWTLLEQKLADRSRQNQSTHAKVSFADRMIRPVKSLFRKVAL